MSAFHCQKTTLSIIIDVSINFGSWTFLVKIMILVCGVEESLPFVPNVLTSISRKLNPWKQRWNFIPIIQEKVALDKGVT